VSKSLFVLLYAVTILAVVASLQSGDLRLRNQHFSPTAELRADVASFQSDLGVFVRRLKDLPLSVHAIWEDARQDFRSIEADAAVHAKTAARRISTLIRIES